MLEEPDYTGVVTALQDGGEYKGISSCFIGNYPGFGEGYSISFRTYSSNNFLRSTLSFFAISMDTGTYKAETSFHADLNQIQKTGCRYSLSFDDGDVAGPGYESRPDGSSNISIDSLNKTTGELWGRFEAKLILGDGFKDLFPNAKDSLQFPRISGKTGFQREKSLTKIHYA